MRRTPATVTIDVLSTDQEDVFDVVAYLDNPKNRTEQGEVFIGKARRTDKRYYEEFSHATTAGKVVVHRRPYPKWVEVWEVKVRTRYGKYLHLTEKPHSMFKGCLERIDTLRSAIVLMLDWRFHRDEEGKPFTHNWRFANAPASTPFDVAVDDSEKGRAVTWSGRLKNEAVEPHSP